MRRPSHRPVVAVCAALLCLAGGWRLTLAARMAQTGAPPGVDPALLSTFHWRSIGPARGGRSIAISGVKGQPDVGYFGATGGGLWKTTDKGVSWQPMTDGQLHSSSVGAVAVSETDTNEVFIGTGESCIRGNIQPGDGVYKSADAGKTWARVGFEHSDAISKIRIDPTNADIVFVADFGKYSVPSEERGVYKSTDGGKTWRRVLYRDDKTGAVDLWIDRHRRGGQRPLQIDRWRRHLDRDYAQPGPAGRHRRQDRRDGLGRRLDARVRARRKRPRRCVPIG
jgi:hypothetical protein